MEMNKGEAEKCLEIGKKHLRLGNWEKAIKFFDKSHRMYPLPGVEAMRNRAMAEQEKTSMPNERCTSPRGGAPSAGMRHRSGPTTAGTSSRSTSSDPSRPYTAEQLQIVRKIKACKTHYEVLAVSQTATDNDIKKAYRKLALKLHPDKNSAPGAEDAFKAVGKAFATLSDPDKRAHYDRYGDDTPPQQQRQHRYAQEDDITPEEIFNMFFGGGFHPRGRRPQQHAHRQQQQEQRGGIAHLAQFFPLLLIFLMSLFSIPSTPEVPFSLNPTPQYNVQRTTQMGNVVKGIQYYVERNFEQRYTTNWRDLSRVEQMVEQAYVSKLADNCENLKMRQKRMIYRARNANTEDREAAMRKALEMKMPPCEELRRMKRVRY